MCGILAVTGSNPSKDAVNQALKTLSKRGPDDHGILPFPNCTLAQTRLSIIDLTDKGHQPMHDAIQNVGITFNGEIYNYQALRKTLEDLGHQFTSHSDTEVILKAYLEYGEECPKYLDGMFAFVIWDEEKKILFMARDRFGKKPLYFAYDTEGRLMIASEIKALFALGIKGVIDPAGIDAYLTLMYIPPWRSIYKNIQVLVPAHSARYADGKLISSRYWELQEKPISLSYADAKEEVRRLFTEAVQKRMLAADVEIGAFLSGGVDSTIVTAYAQKYMDQPIKTFSLGYGDLINELPFAQQVADTFKTDHHTLQASVDVIAQLEVVLSYFDEPHGDSSDFAQHLLSEMTASHVKVALSGDGGDELFLGYGWYWAYWNRPKLIRLLNIFISNPFKAHLKNITVFPKSLRLKLWKDAAVVGTEPIDHLVSNISGSGVKKMNLFDISTYLPGQLLTKSDQMSMMHGLEVRSPFLDYQLAEFVVNLPESYKMDHATGKHILKDILAEIMPRDFVERKKQGFGAPVRKWLLDPKVRTYVMNHFGSDARVFAFLKEKEVMKFIKRVYAHQEIKSFYQLWILLCLELWMRKHDGMYEI